jgi:TPR repeat protein
MVWAVVGLCSGFVGFARSEAAPATPSPLLMYVFRPSPATALVARMDGTWKEQSRNHINEPPEIRFLRQAGTSGGKAYGRAKVIVTPMATVNDEKLLRDDSGGRQAVQGQLAAAQKRSVEKNPVIADTTVGGARFVSFTVTNAHPKPGDFRVVTEGVLTLGGLPSSVTILHDDLPTRDQVVALLAGWSAFGAPDVILPMPDDARSRLEAACRKGDGLACGLAYEVSRATGAKAGDGMKSLTAACNAGSAFACGSLGSLYAEGQGVPKDEARAMKLFVQGCDAHGWLACVNAASLGGRGRPKNAPLPAQSMAFLERACGYAGDRGEVCRASDDAEGSPTAYLAAQRSGCAAGEGGACRRLGWAIETGYGGAVVDVEAARAAYAKACAAHSLWGCFRQALFTAETKEQARLLDAACGAGSGPACYALAQPKYGRASDARRTLARRACDSSVEEACFDVMGSIGAVPK